MKTTDELLIELNSLPEKTQEVVRTVNVLSRAKAKRERRAARNLSLVEKGALCAMKPEILNAQ